MMMEVRPSTMCSSALADPEFGLGIDAGGGLIEYQEAGVVRQGAGEADELLLAGGEAVAALANGLFETLGQGLDEVEQVDPFGCAASVAGRRCRSSPSRILLAMVPVNRCGSWRTTPKWRRRSSRANWRMSIPPMRMAPRWMS